MIPLESLLSTGLVNVDYPPELRATVEDAVASWQQFCSLSSDQKKRFVYTDEGNLDGAGYELKEEAGSARDLKENFHVTLKAYPRLSATALDNLKSLKFIASSYQLVELVTPLVLDFAAAVEKDYGFSGFTDEVEAGRDNWFFRYLHYFGNREVGDEIATPHADKSGFTLHLYESDSGLQYLRFEPAASGERHWYNMPVDAGRTVIISGMQLQYKSGGKLKALCHRVVATERTAVTGRFSVVCFIPFLKTPMYNKKGQGRLQEFPRGFNYTMLPGEFAQLFA